MVQHRWDRTPNAQIWPRLLNAVGMGGKSDAIYLIVGDNGYQAGASFGFIDGYCFLCVVQRVDECGLGLTCIAQGTVLVSLARAIDLLALFRRSIQTRRPTRALK